MNNSILKITLTILIIAFPSISFAGGSAYSQFGLGDIQRYGDSRLYAMGGTGIALIDDGFINGLNPAGLARISFTRFTGGFEYTRFSSDDESGSAIYSKGNFQGLAFAFPISKENGIVMSAEIAPYSTVSYAITSSNFETNLNSMRNQTFLGSGGLSYVGVALSVSPLSTLHFGARANYMYGRTRQYETLSFDNINLVSNTFDRSTYYSGYTFTLGTIFEGIGELIKVPSLHNLTLGLTLTTGTSLDADLHKTYSRTSYYGDDSTVTEKGTVDLPLSLGIGLSYLHNNRYRFLGDVVTENWGSAKYFGSHPSELRNSLRGSIGFEALPLKDADSFWKRIIYRAGVAYNSTYYQLNGIGINEFLMSGGLGFPIGPVTRLNVGLQVGFRGSTDNHLQKDTIIRLSVAVSAAEVWFLKFEEE